MPITAKQKIKKTALADLIQKRLGFAVFLTIHPEKQKGQGFRATIMTRPDLAINAQAAVDQIASELNAEYELED